MFATKGRRLLLIGGVAVAALAGVFLFTMKPGNDAEPVANARKARPTASASAAKPTPNALAANPTGTSTVQSNAKAPASTDGAGDADVAKTVSAKADGAATAKADAMANAGGAKSGTNPPTTAPKIPDLDETIREDAESVFQRAEYTYRSLGRVDPFKSLIVKKDGAQRAFSEKLDPEMIELVGVLTNGGERRALVEDVHGFGYVLKEGDRVLRGRVVSIGDESMKIRHTMYGVTETTTLSLVRKSQGRGLPNDRLR